MKKALALPLLLAAVLFGASACSEPTSRYTPTITLQPEALESVTPETIEASHSLQELFSDLNKETVELQEELDYLDYDQLKAAYPQTLSLMVESSVGKKAAEKLIREYSAYLAEVPEGGSVVINPAASKGKESGAVEIKGSDIYISYPERGTTMFRKGLSMTSDETLNDIFTMKRVDSEWKITGVSF